MYKQNLKLLRENLEITQETIANYLNIHKGLYSQYETEYAIIPSKHLDGLCNFFDTSVDYLFNFTITKNYKEHQDSNKEISGLRLKEFRKGHKLTQEKLASILNTTHSVIADYERGRYLISTPFLYTICKKYSISADYLLGKVDNPTIFLK